MTRDTPYNVGTRGHCAIGECRIEEVTATGNYYVRIIESGNIEYCCSDFFFPNQPSTKPVSFGDSPYHPNGPQIPELDSEVNNDDLTY